ncbi:MAG: hypothetical protein H0W81_06600 [Chloroflexi bacterium]|nr:hypothetical protein [Chloroflexota bacterium]
MAETKKDEASVQINEGTGVDEMQVKPTADLSNKEIKDSILHEADKELHPAGEPEHLADQESVPTPYAPIERPPISTTRSDEPIIQSLVTGAGAHEPPDPEKYDAAGRPRD